MKILLFIFFAIINYINVAEAHHNFAFCGELINGKYYNTYYTTAHKNKKDHANCGNQVNTLTFEEFIKVNTVFKKSEVYNLYLEAISNGSQDQKYDEENKKKIQDEENKKKIQDEKKIQYALNKLKFEGYSYKNSIFDLELPEIRQTRIMLKNEIVSLFSSSNTLQAKGYYFDKKLKKEFYFESYFHDIKSSKNNPDYYYGKFKSHQLPHPNYVKGTWHFNNNKICLKNQKLNYKFDKEDECFTFWQSSEPSNNKIILWVDESDYVWARINSIDSIDQYVFQTAVDSVLGKPKADNNKIVNVKQNNTNKKNNTQITKNQNSQETSKVIRDSLDKETLKSELKFWKELYDDELITKAEYDAKRKELLETPVSTTSSNSSQQISNTQVETSAQNKPDIDMSFKNKNYLYPKIDRKFNAWRTHKIINTCASDYSKVLEAMECAIDNIKATNRYKKGGRGNMDVFNLYINTLENIQTAIVNGNVTSAQARSTFLQANSLAISTISTRDAEDSAKAAANLAKSQQLLKQGQEMMKPGYNWLTGEAPKTNNNSSNGFGNSSSSGVGGVCFFRGEVVKGLNKVCMYNCTGSVHAITQGRNSFCPRSVFK